jgi:hypothetical protein
MGEKGPSSARTKERGGPDGVWGSRGAALAQVVEGLTKRHSRAPAVQAEGSDTGNKECMWVGPRERKRESAQEAQCCFLFIRSVSK